MSTIKQSVKKLLNESAKKKRTVSFRETNYFLPAFRVKNMEFFGGSKLDLANEDPFDLLINVTGNKFFYTVPTTDSPEIFTRFISAMETLKNTPQLVIKWEDFDVPDLPPSSWKALVGDLQAFAEMNPDKKLSIAVFCIGGSGRTGTTLAILRSLMLNDVADPVRIIRNVYKPAAVESNSQISYIEDVTGIDSNCSGSKTTVYKPAATASVSTSTSTTQKPLLGTGKTCSHNLAIQGCKGGCVEFYSKKVDSIVAEHYLDDEEENSDCPACKLGTPGLSHTVACNTRYFGSRGICPECVSDISQNSYNHNKECSQHPDNIEEELPYTLELPQSHIDALVKRFENRTYEEIKGCSGCLKGEYDASFHTAECNLKYFKGDAPF